MSPDQLLTIFLVSAATIVLTLLTIWAHIDRQRDAEADLCRELLEAAGSPSAARFAIDQARTDRKFLVSLSEPKKRASPPRLPSNVVRLRIRDRGRRVNWTPDGAA